jgi:hypothetical protein
MEGALVQCPEGDPVKGFRLVAEREELKIKVDAQVEAILEGRRIAVDEVRKVIEFAENTKNLFINRSTGHFLASLSLSNITYWVEYGREGELFTVFTAYSHRMKILEGFNMPPNVKRPPTDWSCLKCSLSLEWATVKLTYLDETFAADTPACPSCQRAFVSETDAVEKMALAEKMLEDK